MKIFAIAALIATTQAAGSAVWAKADATDGCLDTGYSCAVSACTTSSNDGNVCVPIAIALAINIKTSEASTAPPTANAYLTDTTCKATAACANGATSLFTSAAAAATAIYYLAWTWIFWSFPKIIYPMTKNLRGVIAPSKDFVRKFVFYLLLLICSSWLISFIS